MEGVTSLGAYGGTGGGPWSYILNSELKEIIIHEDGNIKSISFKESTGFTSGTFGGNKPNYNPFNKGEERKIVLNGPVEYLISINGTHGEFDGKDDVILSLSFQTNLKTYGPFGTTTGEPFAIPLSEDNVLVGFFGRCGYYLDALGAYVKPEPIISFGEWGGSGGSPFSFKVGKSWIKQITIRHDSANIKSLFFKDGNDLEYGPFGGQDPNNRGEPTTIDINGPSEFLTSISGTYGYYNGMTVILALSFTTNLQKIHGPFGCEFGSTFSHPIQGTGAIVGFHGKSGHFIDSIGIYISKWYVN
ncbi:hypothetical protein F8388_023664 [Cannabis sativa]|uniref:Jacalin-type lectin domain-containing protein n=2 Tax=Cannabis sativa TaxID=3483 RepID=A0A7J6G9U9_CANSA|nr:hypothetical protein F8388_023664 [Cannabis sativa]